MLCPLVPMLHPAAWPFLMISVMRYACKLLAHSSSSQAIPEGSLHGGLCLTGAWQAVRHHLLVCLLCVLPAFGHRKELNSSFVRSML